MFTAKSKITVDLLIFSVIVAVLAELSAGIAHQQVVHAASHPEPNTNGQQANFVVYDNSVYGIRVKYPSNWGKVENVGNISNHSIVVNFYSYGFSNTSAYTENVNVVIGHLAENNMSLETYSSAGVALLKRLFHNLTIGESGSTSVSGNPGFQIMYTLYDRQSSVKQMQVWTIKDDKDYIITYSASPSSRFDLSTARKIVDSFVILK